MYRVSRDDSCPTWAPGPRRSFERFVARLGEKELEQGDGCVRC